MTTVLPVRLPPQSGQSLVCWLEHLAEANNLSTTALETLLRHAVPAPGLRYLTVTPSPPATTALAHMTGASPAAIHAATLGGYHRLAVDLTGLDHTDRHSYRAVAARGWTPAHGTQICPDCLDDTGIWATAWRLPFSTICTTHHTYLHTTCPACARVFRDHTHTLLRPSGTEQVCGNPNGPGPADHCPQSLTDLRTTTCTDAELATAARIDTALTGQPVTMLGASRPAADYLGTLRALSVLLMYLAGHPDAAIGWARPLAWHARSRGTRARWAIRPPDPARLRAAVFTSADTILTHPTPARLMRQWLSLIPPDGARRTWIRDHTRLTEDLDALLAAALHPTARLSARLPTQPATDPLDLRHIPQVIPAGLYRTHLGAVLPASDTTRLYAALCLARHHRHITTWEHAATARGLPGSIGPATARLCSQRLSGRTRTWLTGLHQLTAALADQPDDYRALETTITARARTSRWFTRWARTHRPGTRRHTRPLAIAWLWVHLAHARLHHAPGWHPGPATPAQRRAYRGFAASLTDDQAAHLAATIPTRSAP